MASRAIREAHASAYHSSLWKHSRFTLERREAQPQSSGQTVVCEVSRNGTERENARTPQRSSRLARIHCRRTRFFVRQLPLADIRRAPLKPSRAHSERFPRVNE